MSKDKQIEMLYNQIESLNSNYLTIISIIMGFIGILVTIGVLYQWLYNSRQLTKAKEEAKNEIRDEIIPQINELKSTLAIVSRPQLNNIVNRQNEITSLIFVFSGLDPEGESSKVLSSILGNYLDSLVNNREVYSETGLYSFIDTVNMALSNPDLKNEKGLKYLKETAKYFIETITEDNSKKASN